MTALSGKVALVTGASQGIGAASAKALAKAGVKVGLLARTANKLEHIADAIRRDGGEAVAISGNVADYQDVNSAVSECVRSFGRLDFLINNAGVIEPISRLADSDPEAWSQAADVNYKGVYFGLRAAIPVMERQGAGVIVNISSGAATSPLEGWSHYCSSKAAALMLTRSADKEYRDQGIRVVGLSPGTVATGMQVAIKASGINPVSQLEISDHISPETVAQAIVWLCTDAASDISGVDVSLRDEAIRRRIGLA
jgi:3-oxoacyl-[acyl-carrier protein] reductase